MPRDRVAIVTGAGRGIGRATARLLAQCGARVLAVARTESELRSPAQEAGVEFIVADLAEPGACERVVAEARRRLGPIEILVNNADQYAASSIRQRKHFIKTRSGQELHRERFKIRDIIIRLLWADTSDQTAEAAAHPLTENRATRSGAPPSNPRSVQSEPTVARLTVVWPTSIGLGCA